MAASASLARIPANFHLWFITSTITPNYRSKATNSSKVSDSAKVSDKTKASDSAT